MTYFSFLSLRTTSRTHPRDLAPTEYDNEDIPPSISVKYPSRQRTFRNSLELFYPSFSSSPRSVYPPFFVSPATTNKGSASSTSSSSSISVKMMRTLEPSTYHPFSISHTLLLLHDHLYSPRTSSSAFPLLSTRHFSVALSPSSIFLDHTHPLRRNTRKFCPLPPCRETPSYDDEEFQCVLSIRRSEFSERKRAECHVSFCAGEPEMP